MKTLNMLTVLILTALAASLALGQSENKPNKYMKQLSVADLDPSNHDLKAFAGTALDPFAADPVYFGEVGLVSVDPVCRDAAVMYGTLRLGKHLLQANQVNLCACAQKRQAADAAPVTPEQAGTILAEAAKSNSMTDEEKKELDLAVKRINLSVTMLQKSYESSQSLLQNAQNLVKNIPGELSKDLKNVQKVPAIIQNLNLAVDQCKAVTTEGADLLKALDAHLQMLNGIAQSATTPPAEGAAEAGK